MDNNYLVAVIDDQADFRDMISEFVTQTPGLVLNGTYESFEAFMADNPLQHDLVLSDLLLEPGAATSPLPTLIKLARSKPALRVLIVTSLRLDRFITSVPLEVTHQVHFFPKNSSFTKMQLLSKIKILMMDASASVPE